MSIRALEIALPAGKIVAGRAMPETVYCQYIESIQSIACYKQAGGDLDALVNSIRNFYQNDHERKQMTLLAQAVGDKELTIAFLEKKLSLGGKAVAILREQILPESSLAAMPLALSQEERATFIAQVSRNMMYRDDYPEKPI